MHDWPHMLHLYLSPRLALYAFQSAQQQVVFMCADAKCFEMLHRHTRADVTSTKACCAPQMLGIWDAVWLWRVCCVTQASVSN
jgi:hypothetical protein